MRIVSGKNKGRRVNAPKKLPVRPTTDMAKEALFNILNSRYFFNEIKVLDLFSGIGSISLEFASRGTEDVTSVDKHFGCIRFLESESEKLNSNLKLIKSDAYKFLESNTQKYDIIFADPPYEFEQNKFEKIHQLVFDNQLLTSNGLLVIEHSKNTDLKHLPYFEQTKRYGGNFFSFFIFLTLGEHPN
jgi:16S rRNA (guanine(966)-N(2))-methyltransferase RsmD